MEVLVLAAEAVEADLVLGKDLERDVRVGATDELERPALASSDPGTVSSVVPVVDSVVWEVAVGPVRNR